MINLTINNQKITAKRGQTILQAARDNGIYIPTLCYLSKVSSIGSCRICVVEVEGSDGLVLSCQTPVREGIKVRTDSEGLFNERQKIMALYDVNHPLECGVCDKSGECELQNKTMEFKVAHQPFAAKEHQKPVENWGFIEYNESLCILCERCVRVCNEVIGDNRLKIHAGGYKSRIVLNSELDDNCTECGECMAVCPVGALTTPSFKYSSNAWELTKIPSTCTHCAAGCELFYEVKHSGIDMKGENRIYRVTNDIETSTLCGSGRFGFGYEKEQGTTQDLLEKISSAKTVIVDGLITNEEAYLLNELSKKLGFKLASREIKRFQEFLNSYAQSSGESFYNATVNDVASSDLVVLFGAPVVDEMPTVRSALNKAALQRAAEVVDMGVVEDSRLSRVVSQNIRYEASSEEGVMALLVKTLASDVAPKEWLSDLDEGYLSAETNVGEEELELLKRKAKRADKVTIVAGSDLFAHPQATNIAKMLGVLRLSGINVLVTPPSTNALGVALICDLTDECDGGLELSSLGLAPLSQQSGTITTIDKRVMPINPAIGYKGDSIGSVANKLGYELEWITDLTQRLPIEKGFKAIQFEDLNFGNKAVGYELDLIRSDCKLDLIKPANIGEFNGTVVRYLNPSNHINSVVNSSPALNRSGELIASAQFATAAKISDGDVVEIATRGGKITRKFVVDKEMKGTVAKLEYFDLDNLVVDKGLYRYEVAKISVREGE